jgi:hypothetical protein
MREESMSLATFVSGLGGATMLALGSDMVIPLGSMIGSLCDLAGIASVMVCFGLMDGA